MESPESATEAFTQSLENGLKEAGVAAFTRPDGGKVDVTALATDLTHALTEHKQNVAKGAGIG